MMLFCDSFDHLATADLATKWTQRVSGSGAPQAVIQSGAGRQASGLRFSAGSGSVNGVQLTVSPLASGVAGCALNLSAGAWTNFSVTDSFGQFGSAPGYLFYLKNAASAQIWTRINQDGTLSVFRGVHSQGGTLLGTTSAAMPTGAWTYLEMKWTIHATTGSVEIRQNGTAILALTNVNTHHGGSADWSDFYLGQISVGGATVTLDLDDVYLCDLTGSVNNTFLGDVRVDAHLPNAVGTTSNWTRSTGADQWATIDDASMNSDTDYNETTTVSNKDTLNFPALTNAGGTIKAVQVCCAARKTDAGSGAIASVIRHSGTDYVATGQNLGTSYAVTRFVHETNPGTSAAWTEAGFNAAELGYQKTA